MIGDLLRFVKQLDLLASYFHDQRERRGERATVRVRLSFRQHHAHGSLRLLTPRLSGPRVNLNAAKVSDILVEGTQRIEPDTVRSHGVEAR